MLKQQLNYAVSGKIKSTAFLIVTIEASGFTNFFKNKCFFYKLLIIILNNNMQELLSDTAVLLVFSLYWYIKIPLNIFKPGYKATPYKVIRSYFYGTA